MAPAGLSLTKEGPTHSMNATSLEQAVTKGGPPAAPATLLGRLPPPTTSPRSRPRPSCSARAAAADGRQQLEPEAAASSARSRSARAVLEPSLPRPSTKVSAACAHRVRERPACKRAGVSSCCAGASAPGEARGGPEATCCKTAERRDRCVGRRGAIGSARESERRRERPTPAPARAAGGAAAAAGAPRERREAGRELASTSV